VVRFVVGRARVGLARAVGWDGARQRHRHRHAPERRARDRKPRAAACPRAPNPRHTGAGGGTQRPSHEDDRRPPLQGAGARSHGVRNGYR